MRQENKMVEQNYVLCLNCQDTGLMADNKPCLYCGEIESDPTNNVLEYLALRDKAESMVW